MPPVPPARRQASTPVAPARPMPPKQARFLALLMQHPDYPSQGLGQERFDALPLPCREALVRVTTAMPYLDAACRAALEAYYASGHKPANASRDPYWWEGDLSRATALMAAPDGDIATLLNVLPQGSDGGVAIHLLAIMANPELKAGEKIRLEAIRLLLQLKGHLRDDQATAVQATQIVIHTAQEPAVRPQEEPKVIEIDL